MGRCGVGVEWGHGPRCALPHAVAPRLLAGRRPHHAGLRGVGLLLRTVRLTGLAHTAPIKHGACGKPLE